MLKKLLSRLFGKGQQRIEAEEAYEEEFGRPAPRSFSTCYLRKMVAQQREPMAARRSGTARRVNSGHGVRSAQEDLSNPLHPLHPLNPVNMQAFSNSRSHPSCDSDSRHHGGHDSHHSSSSYDSGSSDSGSSSSSCD